MVAVDFFSIFNLEQSYNVDKSLLLRRYLELHKEYNTNIHNTAIDIVFINDAYNILMDDFLRLEYIFKINNINDEPIMENDFLLKIFDIESRLESVEQTERDNILDTCTKKLNEHLECAWQMFIEQKKITAAVNIAMARYYRRIIHHSTA